ncbi:bifunctional phosphoribosylaminoimidazolecarboxamide formyltransferase/IMP cyclohydrolase [Legionella londiniensis]|uniref:Bifunctional purine biosynthesis protein PurH n=1 Tax=Legionella londiniensis TaxID=45068 RepID=A0A0W0VRE3_9GAMM|nr:bifunctional phosphoribosylaminoimidazolecarboxamide formyltransferase/IMP cyclohydrolase [Legionella londiniensis]KTD22570.1 bifunctional phosphoribosylaminoimidazolecarboxamide formyltransferase/IMP cyclohydrolase [Legionella londiniensis]STX92501.1 phosphoribosylaminoimidazolecarboxamide formyltransferase [Legionella londiniensis]
MRAAFISVGNKHGLIEVANALVQYGIKLLGSKGTADFLAAHGFSILSTEDYIQMPPMLEGRVKTLHPGIFGGILADRNNPKHMNELRQWNVYPIDFVIVDLYPFSSNQDIEHIDIGGVALIRAAAKNHAYCTAISDRNDYVKLIDELQEQKGETRLLFRQKMAASAFDKSSRYDAEIKAWCSQEEMRPLPLQKTVPLSYGENPHQQADFYNLAGEAPNFTLLQGRPLTYNNLLDLDAGIRLISEFDETAAAVIKHANPCGVALGISSMEAVAGAFHADEKSAFGGIVALNRTLDEETAVFLKPYFIEMVAAPDYTREAFAILSQKPKCRVVRFIKDQPTFELRTALNGFLLQTTDKKELVLHEMAIPTLKQPDEQLYADLQFAFKVVRHMKSNAIVIAKNGVTKAMGVGQANRVDAVTQALYRAGTLDLQNAVLASDGFFPFADSIRLIAKTPIKTIIQPGGSRMDRAVIEACNDAQISMVMTGVRAFRH